MPAPVVCVEHVSKKFCRRMRQALWYGVRDIAGEICGLVRGRDQLRPQEFWAVDDVSFTLNEGEAVGLVGRNGSGKTTLLRMIAGLIPPDRGRIRCRGRVAPLIALGAGFNPLLTGRENIYLNMSILGVRQREIRRRLDAVIEFAAVEDAIDTPVQSYSSGMAARLGFACAVHTDPDVLLIDEVLAVGDSTFRAKCYQRLNELRTQGTAFVMVAHAPQLLASLCDEGVLLNSGKLRASGSIHEVLRQYRGRTGSPFESGDETRPLVWRHSDSPLERPARVCGVEWFAGEEGSPRAVTAGEAATLDIRLNCRRPLNAGTVSVYLRELERAEGLSTILLPARDELEIGAGETTLRIYLPAVSLKPGRYTAKLTLFEASFSVLDIVDWNELVFDVAPPQEERFLDCDFLQPAVWSVREAARHA